MPGLPREQLAPQGKLILSRRCCGMT